VNEKGFDVKLTDTVDVRINLTLDDLNCQEYWRFGRCLLKRSGRDSSVWIGDGTVVLSGTFSGSGGNAKYLRIAEYGGATKGTDVWKLEVRDVPINLLSGEYEVISPKAEAEHSVGLETQVGRILSGCAVEDSKVILKFGDDVFEIRAGGYNDIEVVEV
jgi:hypothetical protein